MNRSKQLYLLLGILVAACVATFAVMQAEDRREQIQNSDAVILEVSGESVQSLSWEYDGKSLSFHKDGAWLCDEDADFPVSEDKINALLEPLQALGAAFVIEDPESLEQYGLEHPVCTIHLSTKDQTYEIQLGDYSPMDSLRYASIADGNVYLLKYDLLNDFDAVLDDMMAHDEIPAFGQVSGIRFSGAESYSIFYEEESPAAYCSDDVYFTRQKGKALPLDTSKVDSYLQGIAGLHPLDYVTYSATEEELQAYGLDSPELTVTVDYTSEGENGAEEAAAFVLSISPDPKAFRAAEEAEDAGQEADAESIVIPAYIRIGESPIVYKISSDDYKKLLSASYDDLRHAEVFWAEASDIRQIDISLDGSRYTLISEKDGNESTWFYQEKELDIAGLQSALNALSADEFTDEKPSQRREISLTVFLDNENFPSIQIDLYRYDGTRCLAAVDGKSVSLVKRADVVDLIEAIHTIVLD